MQLAEAQLLKAFTSYLQVTTVAGKKKNHDLKKV